MTPRDRALAACVTVAVTAGGRLLSIHDYAREAGVSARMLIHHFGTKAGLDLAVVEAVDTALRAEAQSVAARLGGLAAAQDLARAFRAPDSAQVRRLFRMLMARAFAGDAAAVAALAAERARWTALFEAALNDPVEADKTVLLLLGAAVDALLDDLQAGS